ncbi:MAG: hypothetical protein Kow00127_12190 [Bacteroidales bacterium]
MAVRVKDAGKRIMKDNMITLFYYFVAKVIYLRQKKKRLPLKNVNGPPGNRVDLPVLL